MNKTRIFLFAGTTEGREIAAAAAQMATRSIRVYSATAYGGSLIPAADGLTNVSGRLDEPEMEHEFRQFGSPDSLVIDATHPYAVQVTENIQRAASAAGMRYVRIKRTDDTPDVLKGCEFTAVRDSREAAGFLMREDGHIFLTTGSRDLTDYTVIPSYKERLYVRVLPLVDVVRKCTELGITGRHLICMQGPFSEEMNEIMFRETQASWIVTKESGKNGGFEEKILAARKTGCHILVIQRPEEQKDAVSVKACIRMLQALDKNG